MQCFWLPLCYVIILEMLQTHITHNNVHIFYVTVNIYKTEANCHLCMKSVENFRLIYCVVGVRIMQITMVSIYTSGLLIL